MHHNSKFNFYLWIFFPTELPLTWTKKRIQIAQPQIHFMTQVFPELFQRYLTFIVLAKTITEDLKESFEIS